MAIINNKFPVLNTGAVSVKVPAISLKQEEAVVDNNTPKNQDKNSDKEAPSSNTPSLLPETKSSSVGNDFLLTYRGVEIDHIATASDKTVVTNSNVLIALNNEAETISKTYDFYYEKFSKAFPNEDDFKTVFEEAKNKTLESYNKNKITDNSELTVVFKQDLYQEINNTLYKSAITPASNGISAKVSNNGISSVNNYSAAKRSIKTPDGGTITINYNGVFVNGLLVTNPSQNKADCNITITGPDGKNVTIPLIIDLDLIPIDDKNVSREQYFNNLIDMAEKAFSGLSQDAINALINEKPSIVIADTSSRSMDAMTAAAVYTNSINTISLYTTVDNKKIDGSFKNLGVDTYALTHEIGHMKDFDKGVFQSGNLTQLQMFEKLKEMLPPELKNQYALTNFQEFLAEYYAYKNTTDSAKAGTGSKQSTALFNYLENQLKENPNSPLSQIYNQMKVNSDVIIAKQTSNNKSYKDLINELYQKGDYFKRLDTNTQEAINSLSDGALPNYGSLKRLYSLYYEYKYLDKNYENFHNLDGLKPGDKDYNAWQTIKTDFLDIIVDKFDKDYPDIKNLNQMQMKQDDLKPIVDAGVINNNQGLVNNTTGDGLQKTDTGFSNDELNKIKQNVLNNLKSQYGIGYDIRVEVDKYGNASYVVMQKMSSSPQGGILPGVGGSVPVNGNEAPSIGGNIQYPGEYTSSDGTTYLPPYSDSAQAAMQNDIINGLNDHYSQFGVDSIDYEITVDENGNIKYNITNLHFKDLTLPSLTDLFKFDTSKVDKLPSFDKNNNSNAGIYNNGIDIRDYMNRSGAGYVVDVNELIKAWKNAGGEVLNYNNSAFDRVKDDFSKTLITGDWSSFWNKVENYSDNRFGFGPSLGDRYTAGQYSQGSFGWDSTGQYHHYDANDHDYGNGSFVGTFYDNGIGSSDFNEMRYWQQYDAMKAAQNARNSGPLAKKQEAKLCERIRRDDDIFIEDVMMRVDGTMVHSNGTPLTEKEKQAYINRMTPHYIY